MGHGPSISVVICASNSQRLSALVAAVHSVQQQSLQAHELIVVIDHNPELLRETARRVYAIQLIENAAAKGLSGARNTGVRAATGDVVAFLDDDAIAEPGWLQALAAAYADQHVLGVGGPIIPQWPENRPGWLPAEFDWTLGCSYKGENLNPGEIRNLIGCNMSFRRQALLLAGLFDENLGRNGDNGAGGEETDLARRLLAMFPGSWLAHAPGAEVRHVIETHRTRFSYFVKRCLAEGRSKALLADGLSRERDFVLKRLTGAFFGNIWAGLTFRERHGLQRAAAIVIGTGAAGATYLWSRLSGTRPRERATAFLPVQVTEIDWSTLLEHAKSDSGEPFLPGVDADGSAYGAALCVIRQDKELLAVREVPLYGTPIPALALQRALGSAVDTIDGDAKPEASVLHLSARVVIATRDRPDMLDRCLASILEQDHSDFEIVVVDSASDGPETRELLAGKYAGVPRLHYRREERPGLARAHNLGLQNSHADFVAFTDDDVVADRGWLSTLAEGFASQPGVGAVTGGILPAELQTRAQYWTERHGAFLKDTKRHYFDLGKNRPTSPLFPYAAGMMGSGANMAFSRAALEAMGPFDPALGAGTLARGGDDLDAFVSVIEAGFTLAYVPDAIVWHYHRRSEDGMARQAFGYGVGLAAHLTKSVMTRRGAFWHFVRAFPAAIAHMFGPKAAKLERLSADYPKELVWRERWGMLMGPLAYLRSRRAVTATPRRPENLLTGEPVWKGK